MRGRARPRMLATALAVAGCVLLAGCQGSFHLDLDGPSDAELLQQVSLTEQDAADGAQFELYEGGDEVAGRTSLDLCYGDFPSEDLRVGRLQVGIRDPDFSGWVSSEAILYATPAEAEQAMHELEVAHAECPTTVKNGPEPDDEPLTWRFGDAPDAGWPDQPGVRRQAYAFTVTTSDGQDFVSNAVYLQRGRMILGLYSTPPEATSTTIRNAPDEQRYVEVMTNRLSELPEESLQRPNPESTPDTGGLDT